MQANEFEKNVQNKLEKLELVPHDKVWKQVFLRIKKEKNKRRIVFFWIFGALVLLAGTSGYFFVNSENNKKPTINEITRNDAKKENYQTKQDIQKSLPRAEKVQKTQLKKRTVYVENRSQKSIKPLSKSTEKTIDLAKIENKKVAANQPVFTLSQPSLPQQKEYKRLYKKKENDAQKGLIPHKYYNPGAAPAKAVKDSIDSNINSKKDTSANKTAVKTVRINKIKDKKWKAGFTVYSGISDNVSGLASITKAYSQYGRFFPVNLSSGGNYTYEPGLSNGFKSAFSFGIGFFVKKQLSKRIDFSAGVNYHFYNAKSAVGNKVSQQTNFYDSSALKSTFVDGFYTSGNSVTYSNHYQLLELPINVSLQFSKNTNKSLLLTAGISPGYLIASNALYANSSANVYYADKEKFHRFQLSAQSGLLFPVFSSSHFILNAGPAIQYGLINTFKSAADGQHLFFAGIKANIVFR